jgi:signal transduction histidine kinase
MKRWRLNSIAARIAVTIVLAIILGFALELAVGASINRVQSLIGGLQDKGDTYFFANRFGILTLNRRRNPLVISAKIATIARIVAQASPLERPQVLAAMAEPTLQLAVLDAPVPGVGDQADERLAELRSMIEFQLGLPAGRIRLASRSLTADRSDATASPIPAGAPGPDELLAEFALPDGRWLIIAVLDYIADAVAWWRIVLSLSPVLLLIGLLSVWTARRLATPISAFAGAAERLGVDTDAPPLAERGPHELRTAIRAFNRMQERLRRFVNDRTEMVAAMSHDLKTALTRLRLRAEFVGDQEQQRKMLADLDEMTAMIESTLAFARDDAQREPRMLVDLGALVESVCENACDAGGEVSVAATRGVDITCRPSAISRAVANLIDNAVKYGGGARARLDRAFDRAIITIDDDGPGISVDQHEKVFAPFYRLEDSRNRDTGGVGLGLAVARTIAREHGGDITLAAADGGGLRVRLELPA